MTSKQVVLQDGENNQIYLNKGFICVKLAEESSGRRIGYFNKATGDLSVVKDDEEHVLRKANAYGINYNVVKNFPGLDTIIIHDRTGQYNIPKEFWLENGSFLHFKKEGYERQLFLNRDLMKEFKI